MVKEEGAPSRELCFLGDIRLLGAITQLVLLSKGQAFERGTFPAPSCLLEVIDQRGDRGQPSEDAKSENGRNSGSRYQIRRAEWLKALRRTLLGSGTPQQKLDWPRSIFNQSRKAVAGHVYRKEQAQDNSLQIQINVPEGSKMNAREGFQPRK